MQCVSMCARICSVCPCVLIWLVSAHLQDKEVFVDTLTLPTIRKKKKKLDAQESEESQVIWRDVTSALRNRDIQAATAAKHAVSVCSSAVMCV